MRSFGSATRIWAAASFLLFGGSGVYAQAQPSLEQTLKQALSLDPGGWDANYRLGEFYLHAGKLSEGISYMERAVAVQPGNYVAGYDLALAYFETHDYSKARRQIQSMLKTQNTAELHGLLADVEEGAGDYLKAAAEYQTAAQLNPSEDHIFDWGTELVVHQTYSAAIAILARGVDLYPRSPKMNVGLGIALYLNQEYDSAMQRLCAATDLVPTEPWPYLFLGSSYAGMSVRFGTEEVRNRLKRFASNEPRNARALYYYAISLWDRAQSSEQETAQAESLLSNAVALDRAFVDAHLQLGILYSDKRDYPGAISQLASAVRLDPNLTAAHYHLARSYTRTGETLLAKQEFQAFERLRLLETEESQKERNRLVQFIVNMRDEPGNSPAK